MDTKSDSAMVTDADREELSTLYRALDKRYEEEQRDIVKALEKLEVLIAVRDDSQNGMFFFFLRVGKEKNDQLLLIN